MQYGDETEICRLSSKSKFETTKSERRVDSPDFVYFLAESLLPVDYTLAHQAG